MYETAGEKGDGGLNHQKRRFSIYLEKEYFPYYPHETAQGGGSAAAAAILQLHVHGATTSPSHSPESGHLWCISGQR